MNNTAQSFSIVCKSILLTLVLFISSDSFLFAQNNQSTNQSANGLNLNFDIFDGSYYTDPLGIQLSLRMIPFQQIIDRNTYALGTNDLLSVKIDASQTIFIRGVMVNPQGDINLPNVGPVSVNGLTIADAEEKVLAATRDILKTSDVTITLENPRPIYVQVKGGVPHPGKYLIPSQSRVDQALYPSLTDGNRDLRNATLSNSSDILSKGNYSFRNIEIQRISGEIVQADLINYLRTGESESNPIVNDGDLITLSSLTIESPKVSISGAVKTSLEFEFVEGDTPQKLLQIGGGFEETADRSHLLVFRNDSSGIRSITISPGEWDEFMLQPNDRVVAPYSTKMDASASVWVYGEVKTPGNFPIISGQTSAFEVIDLAGGLSSYALPHAAYLLRKGGFRNEIPNKFNADLMRRTSDQLIQGLEYLEAETQLSRNKVFIDLNDEQQMKSLKLFDGDQFYIPRDENTVFVFGQVNNPGYFPFIDNYSPSQYISIAGGFSLAADKDRVFIIKAGNSTWYAPGETSIQSGDRIFIDRQPIEELNSLRAYEVQKEQLKNSRIQLIMTAVTTITGIITTYVAVRNIRN